MEVGGLDQAPATSGTHAMKGPGSGWIEVEQKFIFGPGTAKTLVGLGAKLEGSMTFRDCYYDVPDFRLTLADHWLRQREGTGWELKFPPEPLESPKIPDSATDLATESMKPQCMFHTHVDGHVDRHQPHPSLQPLERYSGTQPATQYLEVTHPREIVARVCEQLGVKPDPGWCENVAEATKELGLQEFASFVTKRCKYHLGNLAVDLDEADFGYVVGEVEVMVRQQEEVPDALESIQKLGTQLGFDSKTRIPGKMSAYLYKFRPAHYNALVQAGRLRTVKDATEGPGCTVFFDGWRRGYYACVEWSPRKCGSGRVTVHAERDYRDVCSQKMSRIVIGKT